MSLLFSGTTAGELSTFVNPFNYQEVISGDERGTVSRIDASVKREDDIEEDRGVSPQELERLLSLARIESIAEVEKRLLLKMEEQLAKEASRVQQSIDGFIEERKQYFAKIEAEVIQLALAIAAKILHREAHVDPMLIAAMVRIALDKLQDGSTVCLRVPSTEVERWKDSLASTPHAAATEIVGDPTLGPTDCILQANLGTVDLGMNAQLKEVEQGFFDLLAQRPVAQ